MAAISAQVAVPGSFSFDTTRPPKLDINVSARSHFFQPPRTPSTSSCPYQSTSSRSSQEIRSNGNRKRSHHDFCLSDQTIPLSTRSDASLTVSDLAGAQTPPPFVNTKYELAGGLDTPTAKALSAMESREEESQVCLDLYRRGTRGCHGFDSASEFYLTPPLSVPGSKSNGRSRLPAPPVRDGLGKIVLSVVGVAGKVLEFCKTTAFKGFYAGGGQGYPLRPTIQTTGTDQSVWLDSDREDASHFWEQGKSSVPGRSPDEDYIPDYMSLDHITPPRAIKKVQREKGAGEISASWVMVNSTPSRETSPPRLSNRKVPSGSLSTHALLLKHGRRPILPASQPSLSSYAGSPRLRPDRPASFASPRSPLSSPKHGSPTSIDVPRYAARMRKRQLEEDAHLKRFNQQLKAMIKEGKEALGTKFEVQEEPMGKAFFE